MDRFSLKMPSSVFCGIGALEQLPLLLRGYKKVALFTDSTLLASGLLTIPEAQIQAAGCTFEVLSNLPPEPTYEQVQAAADTFRASGSDIILAVGGGSVMDAAKLAGIMTTGEYTVRQLLDTPEIAKKGVPTIMVPTTSGTGSEATPNAIVAVPEKELKVGIVNEAMIADAVILDPEMTKSLPRSIAAATGLDALAHAIECFTSNKATPFSDTFALDALERILKHILPACDDPDATQSKLQMQIASFYAGVAITASGTTAVHALSYPLGGKYHIAHGVSNAILLAPVMRFNEPECRDRLATIYDRVAERQDNVADVEKSAWVIDRLEQIVRHLDIPDTLQGFGVSIEDIDQLVAAAMQVTRLLINNKRTITPEDARSIYLEII